MSTGGLRIVLRLTPCRQRLENSLCSSCSVRSDKVQNASVGMMHVESIEYFHRKHFTPAGLTKRGMAADGKSMLSIFSSPAYPRKFRSRAPASVFPFFLSFR